MMKIAFAAILAVAVGAVELTPANWDAETAGKTTFIKFQAPWWGHCKKMKPDWDKLMTEYANHATILIADVDCTTEGKPLCDSNGVKGFPTIKYGDVANLEAYEGGRSMSDLQAFAKGLKPACSPANIDLCDAEGKAAIEKIQAMSDEELEADIDAATKKAADAESHFATELEKLQATYKALQQTKDDTLAEVKDSGVGMLKAVKAARAAAAKAGAAKEEL